MAYSSVYKSLLGFSAAILASGFLFLAISSQAAPVGAPVITGDIEVNPAVPKAREEAAISLKAGGASDDKTAAKDLIYFWDFGAEYETALGNSASSPNLGEVKHYFDNSQVYNASLRVIDADGNVSDPKTFQILVDPIAAPDTSNRAKWPLAHITRPGNGPYAVGSVKFSGTLSQPGIATAQIVKDAGFEWHLFDSNRTELTVAGTGPNAVIGRTGNDFTYTFSNPGYYYLTLRATQINPDFFDIAIFAFEVTSNASRVASQVFSAAITSNVGNSVTLTSDDVSQSARFTATITGGLPNFIYTWNYPPSTNEFVQSTNETIYQTSDSPSIIFTSPGTKPIYLRVRDTAWREVSARLDFQIIDANYKGTSYSPPLPTSFATLPLSLTLTPINADLLFTAPPPTTLNGPIPAQVINFQAAAGGGLPQYSYSWSPTGRQGVCQQNTCTYSFNKLGNYTVMLGITDHSSPPQVTSQTRNIVISAVAPVPGSTTPPPSGGTGGTTGGTAGGAMGGTASGGTAGGTTADPNDVSGQYGLGSGFNIAIGQKSNLKDTIVKVINIILGFLGIIAVIIILYGGFKWMTAAGNEDKVSEARKMIIQGVIGLAVILVAWGIASFVINQLYGATAA